MTNLVVHIGEHKTGSTSIQDFLNRNSTALLSRPNFKILYPQSGLLHSAHHHLAYAVQPEISSVGAGRELGVSSHGKDWDDLRQEILDSQALLTVLSCETFENNRAQHLRNMVHDHLDGLVSECKIVLYIRPLIELLISRYSQLTAYEDFPMDFEVFSAQNLTNPNLFWSQRLIPWFDAFGKANVSARGYIQKEFTKQDVVLDFASTYWQSSLKA